MDFSWKINLSEIQLKNKKLKVEPIEDPSLNINIRNYMNLWIGLIYDNTFILSYKKLDIGTLKFKENKWFFEYTDEFKAQKEIVPILDFPDKDYVYISTDLWLFFKNRIPSLKNPYIKSVIEKENIQPVDDLYLLKRFGEKVLTNPFLLKYNI